MFVVKLSSCGDNLIVADRLFHTAGHGYPETDRCPSIGGPSLRFDPRLFSVSWRAGIPLAAILLGFCFDAESHDRTNAITWNREISRIFYARCASCHHQGGAAFSLMTYREVQPRAVAIKEAVLSRRMPPWGAVKGFGDFRNDQGLTQEELEVITEWIESDAPRGNNPGVLPKEPKFETSPFKRPKDSFVVIGETTFVRPLVLDGILPEQIPEGASPQIVAVVPDGRVEPLVWFYEYKNSYQHPFLFREPLDFPAGTIIRGVPPDAEIVLIPRKEEQDFESARLLTSLMLMHQFHVFTQISVGTKPQKYHHR